MKKYSRILITGAAGMAGKAVHRRLLDEGYTDVYIVDKVDYDLREPYAVRNIFDDIHPEYVFHIAARVGGIHANDTQSGLFIYDNLMMQCNVIEAARKYKVDKLLFCGSACIYPKYSPQPIKEEALLSKPLEETNKAYAVAKIAGVTMCQMYAKQYGCNFISAMPTNLYGIGDNFQLQDSHVMPALLRKFHEAVLHNYSSVEVWGTGKPRREFLYIDDLADGFVFLMNNYNDPAHINIGTGEDISISELVEMIKEITGFKGVVKWNTEYPDGVFERRLDVSRINALGWKAQTKLREGIERTYEWFKMYYNSDAIRK